MRAKLEREVGIAVVCAVGGAWLYLLVWLAASIVDGFLRMGF